MEKNTNDTYQFVELSYLKKVAEGSDEFIKEMISAFLIQTPQIIKDMNRYLNEKKWTELRGVAHKIKPSVDFMGLSNIKETVKNIEKYAGEQTNLDLLPELISQVEKVCQGAVEELKEELKKY